MKFFLKKKLLLYLSGVILTLLVWYVVTISQGSNLNKFSPFYTYAAFQNIFMDSKLWQGVFETLKRLFGGLVIASFIGIPTGIFIGFYFVIDNISYIPIQFLRMISPLSWTPIAIILFGVGAEPVYFLITIATVWPIIINTANGVKSVNNTWIEIARCLGADNKAIIRHILLRATLPNTLTGLQLALGVAWIVLVPAEMLGVASGLGYMILDYRDIQSYGSIMSIIIIIGFLGLLTDLPLRYLIKKYRW